MQGLILAAGMGKRLKELTKNNTKCMVKVDGVTLIERVLHQLDRFHLSRVVIVVGYEGQKLIDFISTLDIETPIVYVNNPIYDKTNNIYSLALAKSYLLEEDTLLLESDLIFEDSVLETLLNDPRETLALVDKYESWMDGTCVKIGPDDSIEAFVPGKKFVFEDIPKYYKTVNIYKFSKHFSETHYVPFLDAYSKALGNNEYYEQVLRVITMLDDPEIKAKKLEGQLWYEIDDIQDLDIATSMFSADDERKVENIQGRYGGYWRYPRLLDFCYLVNPYYPPQKLINEMKSSFATLLTQYPSGMRVNSLLAAKNFGIHQEHVLVGNGAYLDKVKRLVNEKKLKNVHLLPFQPYEDISHVFSLGDASLVISKPGTGAASVPSKTWSIMSASRPVLANFDENELKQIVEKHHCGIFTKAGDKEAFKQSILALYNNREMGVEMGKNGRQFVMDHLTREVGTQKYVDVIKSVVAEAKMHG